MSSAGDNSTTDDDNVPTHIVVGVLGSLLLLAAIVVSGTSTSAVAPDCPQGKILTPKDSADVRTAPRDSAALLLNQKATAILGSTQYHVVDRSTSVQILNCSGDWVEVAITQPGWMKHVRGWVQLREISNAPVKAASPFGPFNAETRRATSALKCAAPKVTRAQFGMGALYGCIQGRAETAKYWINEDGAAPGRVENVKVMWNDWTNDAGWGVHADRLQADRMVRTATRLYAPELEQEIVTAYFGRAPQNWKSGKFSLEYRWTPGPTIDEHLLIISSQ